MAMSWALGRIFATTQFEGNPRPVWPAKARHSSRLPASSRAYRVFAPTRGVVRKILEADLPIGRIDAKFQRGTPFVQWSVHLRLHLPSCGNQESHRMSGEEIGFRIRSRSERLVYVHQNEPPPRRLSAGCTSSRCGPGLCKGRVPGPSSRLPSRLDPDRGLKGSKWRHMRERVKTVGPIPIPNRTPRSYRWWHILILPRIGYFEPFASPWH